MTDFTDNEDVKGQAQCLCHGGSDNDSAARNAHDDSFGRGS
jgi:hypothetical protein